MSAADKLAQVLAEHMRVQFGPSKAAHVCECSARIGAVGSGWVQDLHAAHVAAVALAHLTAEGWAQGREEFGVRYGGGDVYENSCEDAARESIKYARDEHGLIGTLVRRRVTDWEPAETGDQE